MSSLTAAECEEQIEERFDMLPTDLECTGLYSDFKNKKIAKGIETFAPAYKLWSDGSEKSRWLKIPDGEQIDTSDMREWKFPVGTQLWKEFRANDERAETRLYKKVRSDLWRKTTYIWDGDKSASRLDTGMEMAVNGVDYQVPSSRDCSSCHQGNSDEVMGFEAVSLGLPGADQDGYTLQKLVDEDLLSDPPEKTQLVIGDDGTGKAADALGWLHINCGVTCHNANPNANAEVTDLRMKLDPSELDGRSPTTFEAYTNLVNGDAQTTQWQGRKRIMPGNPEESLLFELITNRVAGGASNLQMPPLATRLVPEEQTEMILEWIAAMEPGEPADEEETGPE